jgi:ABC-2 type transport system permease protein
MLRNWIRSRSGVFFSILFPVMLLLIFATIFGGTGGDSKYLLYLQNMDLASDGSETNLSTTLKTIMNESDLFIMETVPADVDAREYVSDHIGTFGAFRLLVIPEGFESHILNASIKSRLQVTSNTTRDFIEQAGDAIPPAQKIGIELGIQQLDVYASGLNVGGFNLTYIRDPSNTASQIVEGILHNFVASFNYMLIGVRSETGVESEDVVENEYSISTSRD